MEEACDTAAPLVQARTESTKKKEATPRGWIGYLLTQSGFGLKKDIFLTHRLARQVDS